MTQLQSMTPSTQLLRPYKPYEDLKQYLKEADYDGALKLVDGWDLRTTLHSAPLGLPLHRLTCMITDVLDYGGRYDDALRIIQDLGEKAKKRLSAIKSPNDVGDEPAYEKQLAWAVMLWGMCFYRGGVNRAPDYSTAKSLFQLARDVLEYIQVDCRESCLGTLARSWYCIGLVERQEHEYRAARRAFRRSIELAGRGIEQRRPGQGALSFDYNIARCYGLGIGWIAYNGARLDEAAGALVIARRLMMSKRAKFISSYMDVVYAAITLSESMEISRIKEAVGLLEEAVATFLPEKGFRHTSYALRAQNELALAYLRLATVGPSEAREHYLREAARYVDRVKQEAKKSKAETRTSWMATITEARILRERGDCEGALKLTNDAREKGGHMKFTLIDACIGFGEAAMGLKPPNPRAAIEAFEEALRVGGNNRKVEAVCHLHLCRAYLEDNRPSKAMEHFKLWELLEPNIENAFIADFGVKTRKLVTHSFQPFFQSKDDLGQRPAFVQINAFRKWLAETAMALRDDDADGAASLLSIINQFISKQTSVILLE